MIGRIAALGALAVFIVFWTWALFFASKEAINRFDDRAWAERAESICAERQSSRTELADFRRIDPSDPDLMRERAELIDAATDIVETMIDEISTSLPNDPKGAEIVPLWLADYRDYIENRRRYADTVRLGVDEPFREARRDNLPITERLEVFATDNEMGSCAPPRDI